MSPISIPSAWLHRLGQLQREPQIRAFERAAAAPESAQRERLRAIMALSARTEFGRKHGLAEVASLADLQRRVPVGDYSSFAPSIDREMLGHRGVICGERPVLYALSSGTTGAPKCVPFTPSYRAEFQTSLLTSMGHVYRRHPHAFRGRLLYFVAPARVRSAQDGTDVGYTSGYNFERMPALVRQLYAVPAGVAASPSVDAKTYLTAWFCAMNSVSLAGAVFPLALLEVLRSVPKHAEALARDFERGTLRDDLGLAPAQYAAMARHARRDRALAERIRSVFRDGGAAAAARAVFPDLKLVYCWTAASASTYIPDLRAELHEGVVIADGVYAANEGWSNVPLGDGLLGGPISVRGHFYEFVEEAAWDRGVRDGIGAHELTPGSRYRIVLTTSAGLVRYDLGDTVECTGHYLQTPRIHFSGRSGAHFNIAGERMEEQHIRDAVTAALRDLGLSSVFFVGRPQLRPTARWEVLLELAAGSAGADAAALRQHIDDHLKSQNFSYKDRHGFTLHPLALRLLESGTFERYRASKLASGTPMEQSKVVHLATSPDAFNELPIAQTVELA